MLGEYRVMMASEDGNSGQGSFVDVSTLANILMQARGPILDRLSRQLPKLTGDGSVDVLVWLADLERLCTVEKVEPVDIIGHMLDGNAARVYRWMVVGDAAQWVVVKDTLTAEYALPRQEAWRRFTARQLGADEPVDVYLDDLERLGGRFGLSSSDLAFRVKFYEGLPTFVYDWAVSHEGAYTAEFNVVVSRVRERILARRSAAGRSRRMEVTTNLAASGRQASGGSSKVSCYRCGGEHLVKVCPQRPARRTSTVDESASVRKGLVKTSSSKRKGCFACGEPGHFARDCTTRAASGTVAETRCGDEQDFSMEGASRGDAPSVMESE